MRKLTIPFLLALLLVVNTNGYTSEPIKPLSQEQFSPIVIPIGETFTKEVPSSRPIPSLVNKPTIVKKAIPTVKPNKIIASYTGHKVSGVASWYCKTGVSRCTRGYGGGMYAAIRRNLLFLRGKVITVTANDKSIKVRVIDCNCGPNANLIDLYSDAFKKLAPLSSGAVKVTVSW